MRGSKLADSKLRARRATLLVLVLLLAACASSLFWKRLREKTGSIPSQQSRPLELRSQEQLANDMMSWRNGKQRKELPGAPLYPLRTEAGYITWEHDPGGLNNIRLQIQTLMMLAHLFNRTLVMPEHLDPAIDHLRGIAQVTDFWDFEHMKGFIRIISMQDYLDIRSIEPTDYIRRDGVGLKSYLRNVEYTDVKFPEWNAEFNVLVPGGNKEAPGLPPYEQWITMAMMTEEWASGFLQKVEYGEEFQAARTLHFGEENARLLGVPAFIYFPSRTWQDYYWAAIQDYGQYKSELMVLASKVVHRIMQKTGGRYNALHFRSTDWEVPAVQTHDHRYAKGKTGWWRSIEEVTPRLAKALGTALPIFVASDSTNRSQFDPLVAKFPEVIFLQDFAADILSGMHFNEAGVIDQLVCSMAQRFVGSFGSTFTTYIHRLRGYRDPALGLDKAMFFLNYPYTEEDWDHALSEGNNYITNDVWWPHDGINGSDFALLQREWVMTYEFPSQNR